MGYIHLEHFRPQQLPETGSSGMLLQTGSSLVTWAGKGWPTHVDKRRNRTCEGRQYLVLKGECSRH